MSEKKKVRRYLAAMGIWVPWRAKVRGRVISWRNGLTRHRVEILPVYTGDRLIRVGKAMLLHDTIWADGTASRYRRMMEEDLA